MKFHPSYYIKDYMNELNISNENMAHSLDMDLEPFMKFMNEEMSVDIDLANKLAGVIGSSVDVWINLQREYDKEDN